MAQFQARTKDEEDLIATSRRFGDAEVRHDDAALDRLLHDTFVFARDNGQTIVGKAAFIELTHAFTFTAVHEEYDHVVVDGDTGVVVTTTRLDRADGAKSAPYRVSVTYVKRDGRWRALSEHICSLTGSE